MKIEDYFDFIAPDDIRIKGHRIGMDQLVEYYRQGYSPEQIAQEFPGLSLEKIYATITYYLHNKVEVEALIERLRTWQEERYQRWLAQPSPVVQRLQAIQKERQQAITV